MATEFSLQQSTLNMNGFTFTGWSDDEDSVSFPEIEIAKAQRSADGMMISTQTGKTGGPLIFKFLPNSPSVKYLQNIWTQIQAGGASVQFNGLFIFNTGIVTTVKGGYLMKVPSGPTIGSGKTKVHEYTWEFESIISEYITANF